MKRKFESGIEKYRSEDIDKQSQLVQRGEQHLTQMKRNLDEFGYHMQYTEVIQILKS